MKKINPAEFDHFIIKAGFNATFYNWHVAAGNWSTMKSGQLIGVKPNGDNVLIDMR